jgi:hypothetical protein
MMGFTLGSTHPYVTAMSSLHHYKCGQGEDKIVSSGAVMTRFVGTCIEAII